MNEGLIDTNVFIHAQTTDSHSVECRAFLSALESGSQIAFLEPVVLHELSFAWRHYFRDASRREIADFLLTVVAWPGITADKRLLAGAVQRWADSDIGFVDCLLAERAVNDSVPVYTKNVRDLRGQGAQVPEPLRS